MTTQRILNFSATFVHEGTSLGNCSPRDPLAYQRIQQVAQSLELSEVVLMKVAFTNLLAEPDQINLISSIYPQLWSTSIQADAFVLDRVQRGVFIANADCAIGVLATPEKAVVMHLGLGCVWRDDGAPTLLERAVELLGSVCSPSEMRFWIGGAIGPCCHGYHHSSPEEVQRGVRIVDAYGLDVLPGKVQYGPRRGAWAYDHQLMAMRQAQHLGVVQIEADRRCTSCSGMSDPNSLGYGDFFSNTRDQHGGKERNLALVCLDHFPLWDF